MKSVVISPNLTIRIFLKNKTFKGHKVEASKKDFNNRPETKINQDKPLIILWEA